MVSEYYKRYLWLAPFRGLCDIVSDAKHGRMTGGDVLFLVVLVCLIVAGR